MENIKDAEISVRKGRDANFIMFLMAFKKGKTEIKDHLSLSIPTTVA